MFRNLFKRNSIQLNGLFTGHYVGVGQLYVALFNRIPNMIFISELDTSKVFVHMKDNYRTDVLRIHQHNYFEHKDKQVYFNNSIFILRERRMVELTDTYAQILYKPGDFEWANKILRELVEYRVAPVPVKGNRIIGFARDNDAN